MKEGYVYILANSKRTVLYTGVTSDLLQRVFDHKKGQGCEFSKKYNTYYLMYYDIHQTMYEAITREKQIKKWNREWKVNLIRSINPTMKDFWNEILPDGRMHF
ncbi:MAG TPA: hypothetical protein DD671_13865 [Balneolaceae bacterium]|nr:hypothetical protein [Balneola sp.]HBQ60665.1 hypothetical protein [Balneolaceae bacterium]|tara:strand:- start:60189 stop:60497 length:309 start_codon:yes stop_codon:yes gene_type:complete